MLKARQSIKVIHPYTNNVRMFGIYKRFQKIVMTIKAQAKQE